MRFPIKLALAGVAVAGALAVAPALPANAAVHHPHSAAAVRQAHRIAIPLRLVRGTHMVSQRIRMPTGAHPGQAASGTDPSTSVRVGTNNCGGYNGQVQWGIGYIETWGELWDNCDYYTPNTTVYLYIKYSIPTGTTNWQVADVSGGSTGVGPIEQPTGIFSPGGIYVDACLKWDNGWGCGPAQHL